MSSNNNIIVAYEPLREIVFGDIPATYLPTNTASSFYLPSKNPIRIIKIKNTTDANVYISFVRGGAYDLATLNPALLINNDYIPAHSGDTVDYNTNHAMPSGIFEQQLNTQVFIKYDTTAPQVAPTVGKVTLTFIYASPV